MWPISGVTILPQRPVYDGLGNVTAWTNLEPIENALFALDPPVTMVGERGMLYSQTGSLFVPKGAGLANADRMLYQNRLWDIVGEAEWDMTHPMTGDDFGYVSYAISWGG